MRRWRGDHRGARAGLPFTTFSYALSLLRPEIIHELDLVEHGFLPLMMPSSFHPTGDGDYLLFGDDHQAEPPGDPPALAARRRRLRALPPRPRPGLPGGAAAVRQRAAQHLRQGPRGRRRHQVAARPPRRRRAEGRCTTWSGCSPAAPRTGSTTTSSTRRSRATTPRPRSSAPRSARCRRAPGWCCCSTRWASTTATSARGRSTRAATAASPRCSPGRRRRTAPRSGSASPVAHLITDGGPGGRRRAGGRHRVPRAGRRLRARPAAYVPRARRPARAAARPGRQRRAG